MGDNQRGRGREKTWSSPLGVAWGMSSGHFVIDRDGVERVAREHGEKTPL